MNFLKKAKTLASRTLADTKQSCHLFKRKRDLGRVENTDEFAQGSLDPNPSSGVHKKLHHVQLNLVTFKGKLWHEQAAQPSG
jgi:hypothetical protein